MREALRSIGEWDLERSHTLVAFWWRHADWIGGAHLAILVGGVALVAISLCRPAWLERWMRRPLGGRARRRGPS